MIIESFLNLILHLDNYISSIVKLFGPFTYLILFFVIFFETGLVVTPFLPGDSLLFVVGTFAAQGVFNIFLVLILLIAAAVFGDSVNYFIGNYFGENVFEKSRLFKRKHLEKTKRFYEKHGGKTIFLARFIPIIRTFAPFVAGVGKMPYKRFLVFNIVGGVAWVSLFVFSGYFFGTLPFVKNNLSTIIIGIIILSVIPILLSLIRKNKNQ